MANLNQYSIKFILLILALIIILGVALLSPLQTIPNGSSHYFMIDVGETQIVLNNWGTLHATGYPLYVIIGNILTGLLRLISIDALVAAALVSTLWGIVTLLLLYMLLNHLTQNHLIPILVVIAYSLTRSVWIHFVIAEIYTFGLAIVIGLLVLALWRGEIWGRLCWMALLGGIGIAHHRATAMMIPALLVAVWPYLVAEGRRLPRTLLTLLLLGLAGFSQYAYLYLRGQSTSEWVYGDPGKLSGLWDQFIGKEANRFIGLADSWDALRFNFDLINQVLSTDLTIPGLLLGIIGLVLALRITHHRRTALAIILLGLASYIFHILFYSDVLSALILQVTVSLAFGWAFLLLELQQWLETKQTRLPEYAVSVMLTGVFCVALFIRNYDFINDLTSDPTGLETVALVKTAPPDSTVMLAWGPRFFAANVAQDIRGELQDITLVDHQADFRQIASEGMLLTPDYTRFNQPPQWWRERLGSPIYASSSTPGLVTVSIEAEIMPNAPDSITLAEETLTCADDRLLLNLTWWADQTPERELRRIRPCFIWPVIPHPLPRRILSPQ